jgi:hypothetical protein
MEQALELYGVCGQDLEMTIRMLRTFDKWLFFPLD